jgi:hypothetical protein
MAVSMSIETERRRGRRLHARDEHGIISARVRPGHDVRVIDVSAGGALVETTHRLLPGAAIDLHLATSESNVAVRGRVLRCAVARLHPTMVAYRGAIGFERHLPWFVEEDETAGRQIVGSEVRPRRAGRAAGSPTIVA